MIHLTKSTYIHLLSAVFLCLAQFVGAHTASSQETSADPGRTVNKGQPHKPIPSAVLKKALSAQPILKKSGTNQSENQRQSISSNVAKTRIVQTTTKVSQSKDLKKDNSKKAAKTKKPGKKKPKKRVVYKRSGICRDLDRLARRYKLPPLFFARLIWQESGFNPYAVSPAGAEGIAQFMPATAAIWGLEDPFEPGQALLKSAQYLSWLHKKLGNLGLAAAGYNAGSQRVKRWLAGTSFMPTETRNYVFAITGYSVDEWAKGDISFVDIKVKGKMSPTACKQLKIALRGERPRLVKASYSRAGKSRLRKGRAGKSNQPRLPARYRRRLPRMAWGVQLAGSFSRAKAMRQFRTIKRKYGRIIGAKRIVLKSSRQGGRGRRTFHRVRIGTKTRLAANNICKRLKSAGGFCVVLKN